MECLFRGGGSPQIPGTGMWKPWGSLDLDPGRGQQCSFACCTRGADSGVEHRPCPRIRGRPGELLCGTSWARVASTCPHSAVCWHLSLCNGLHGWPARAMVIAPLTSHWILAVFPAHLATLSAFHLILTKTLRARCSGGS